jgi:hypothetical protein
MRSFKEFSEDNDQDPEVELDEGALRNIGAAVLFGRILNLSRKIKRTKDLGEKLDLMASQNSNLAALGLAAGKFLEKSNR